MNRELTTIRVPADRVAFLRELDALPDLEWQIVEMVVAHARQRGRSDRSNQIKAGKARGFPRANKRQSGSMSTVVGQAARRLRGEQKKGRE